MSRKYFYGLDAVRFASALMVAFFHLGYSIHRPNSRGAMAAADLPSPAFGEMLQWGHVGVQIFFVISGLVIANSANESTAARFIQSRAERLYPAVWVCATISLLVWVGMGTDSLSDLLSNYFKSMSLFPTGGWIDAPYWTLGHEVIFYFAVSMLLILGLAHRLEAFAIVIASVSAVFWIATAAQEIGQVEVPFGEILTDKNIQLMLTKFGCFFALGMFIWLYTNSALSALGWGAALVSLVTCFANLSVEAYANGSLPIAELAVWSAAMVAITIGSIYGRPIDSSHLGLVTLRNLGLATYPLYLIHYAPGIMLLRTLNSFGISAEAALIIVVSSLIAFAIFVALILEPKIRALIRTGFDTVNTRWKSSLWLSVLQKPNAPISIVLRNR